MPAAPARATTRCRRADAASRRRARRRSTCTPTRRAPTASSSPPSSSPGGCDAGVRLLALTDHDTLAGYREVVAAGAVPAGPDADPRRRDQRASSPATSGCGRASCTSSASAMDPPTRRSRRPSPRQRDRRRDAVRADASRGCASSGMPIDDQVARRSTSADDDALGRPTVARALIAAGLRDERRGRVPRGSSAGAARRTCRAQGLGPVEAIEAIRGGRRAAGRWPTSARRRRSVDSCASSSTPGLGGLEVYYRSFDAATVVAVGEVARRSAWSRPAAPTTTATPARTPRRTPSCGSRPRSAAGIPAPGSA